MQGSIKKIEKIKNLGILSDALLSEVNELLRFNVFYGWNGCGKTTLSKLFCSLQVGKNLPGHLSDCEYKLCLESGEEITEKTGKLENVKVFNEDFINDNIDWNNKVKSILLISQESIVEIEDLKKERIEHDKAKAYAVETRKILDDSLSGLERILSLQAKAIKLGFQVIKTSDTYYFNYDKTKLVNFISSNEDEIKDSSNILSDEEKLNLYELIKPNDRTFVNFTANILDFNAFNEAESKISTLLKANITNGVIERLKNHTDISKWIEEGLKIHTEYGENKCEFCGNDIDIRRLNELRGHFSDELSGLRKKLELAKSWLQEKLVVKNISLESTIFYQDLQKDFDLILLGLSDELIVINSAVKDWIECLEEKIANPSVEVEIKNNIINATVNSYNLKLNDLVNLVKTHNDRVSNFDLELKNNQKKLELHYAAEFEKKYEYFKLVNGIKELRLNVQTGIETLEEGKNKILEIEGKLSNETLGAEQFNKTLAKFIGHNDIGLQFSDELKGYQIIRNHNRKPAKNLSEGEKTAIAFVYFITKLKEKEDLSNEIIVLDDPISSFDSNNLFSAYSFIKSELETSGQLIILTHNFTFFRLIRDWLVGKNKKDKPKKSEFFQLDIISNNPRKAIIKNIDSTLIDYNSEYHYVFSKLYNLKDEANLSLEKSFQAANLSRKLLESFLSFKYPAKRSDFRLLFDESIKKFNLPETEASQINEKIYKFINKYSHLQSIDFSDDSENNQLGETDNVIGWVLEIIEKNDKGHYDEMVEIVAR
ncbi:MAG: AAA family ATPase [Candidatus Paceibacterota bacterium]